MTFTTGAAVDFHRRIVRREEVRTRFSRPQHRFDDQAVVDALPLRREPGTQLVDQPLVLLMEVKLDRLASDRRGYRTFSSRLCGTRWASPVGGALRRSRFLLRRLCHGRRFLPQYLQKVLGFSAFGLGWRWRHCLNSLWSLHSMCTL